MAKITNLKLSRKLKLTLCLKFVKVASMLLYQSSELYKLQLCLTRRRNCVQVVVFV